MGSGRRRRRDPVTASRSQAGSVTAELVILLPVVVGLFGLLATIGNLQVENIRLAYQAGQFARAYAISQDSNQLNRMASQLQIRLAFSEQNGWMCVTAKRSVGVATLGGLHLEQSACNLAAGY